MRKRRLAELESGTAAESSNDMSESKRRHEATTEMATRGHASTALEPKWLEPSIN